jgi:amino-acid N-acetyltransferase
MKVRGAKIADAHAIHNLINSYAELAEMLFRSPTEIYENLQTFIVAESDGDIVGCCELQIIWSDLAEIKSLAVKESNLGKGAGKMLVAEAVKKAKRLGIKRVLALTLKPKFFEKLGFERIEKNSLPMKVWRDCAHCSKQEKCDEVAVIKVVSREA